MKILSCLCSYKGTRSSREANQALKSFGEEYRKEDTIDIFPLADGGEGTLACFFYLFPKRQVSSYSVPSPIKKNRTQAKYGILKKKRIIESSQAIGLSLNPGLDFEATTSYGIGVLLKHGLDLGFRSFIVGLGGVATNDQGAGALEALGARFYDKDGYRISPSSGNLGRIEKADLSDLDPRIKDAEVTLLCDVTSPLFGDKGSTYLFASQKGAEKDKLSLYEEGRKHFNNVLLNCGIDDVSSLPSSGAAGGLGAFFFRFFKSTRYSGAMYLLEQANRKKTIGKYDFVLLGEGKTDRSTLQGKSLLPVLRLAKENRIPCVLLSGRIDREVRGILKDQGISYFYPLHEGKDDNYRLNPIKNLKKAYSLFRSSLKET